MSGWVVVSSLVLAVGAAPRPAVPAEPPLRLGIAGLTHSHVHGILGRKGADDVRIVGIAEANRELAERYAKRYGLDPALLFGSIEEMLEAAKPQAVAAFGPTTDHRAVVEACAPRGVHVMVEKPLAFDVREALAMQALVEKHRIHLLTNFETTWYPSVHAARALVRDGAVGEIRKVLVSDGHRGPKEIGVEPGVPGVAHRSRPQRRRGPHRLRLLRGEPDDVAHGGRGAPHRHRRDAAGQARDLPAGGRRGDDRPHLPARPGHPPGLVELAGEPQGHGGLRRARLRPRPRPRARSGSGATRRRRRRRPRPTPGPPRRTIPSRTSRPSCGGASPWSRPTSRPSPTT